MDPLPSSPKEAQAGSDSGLRIKTFGVGAAGSKVLELLIRGGFPSEDCVAVDTAGESLPMHPAAEKVRLETKLLRGLGSGGDPERGRTLAEEQAAKFKTLCEGTELVFVVTGLGGGCGSGAAPVIAAQARQAGALVIGFAMTPFECEGSRRMHLARKGLEALKDAADAVICLPNQKLLKAIDENASVVETFRATNELLADAVRSLWRLATHKGLIDLHFSQLCELLRDQHSESVFAAVEASGPARSREVLDRLFNHPLLDSGAALPEADAVLVSLMGGPDLTIAEVNRVMQEIHARAESTQVTLGAAIHASFQDRLAVAIIASHKTELAEAPASRGAAVELSEQLLGRSPSRTHSRFLPPAPDLPPDQVRALLSRQGQTGRGRKAGPKLRQGQLPLEIVSKGRFDKSEPTIHKGEDLDVPTYIRRGIALN